MASIDLISSSFKAAWHAVPNDSYVPSDNIYLGRPQKPNQLAGFPYIALVIAQTNYEPRTQQFCTDGQALVTYNLQLEVWTCQGQTGGASSGDQVSDQGNIQRAVDAILTKIPPGSAWYDVPFFLHCLKDPRASMEKDEELYEGNDVWKSKQSYNLLILE